MRHKAIIDKRFLALRTKVKRKLDTVPYTVYTASHHRKFFQKIMGELKSQMLIKTFKVKVDSSTCTFTITYGTYFDNEFVVVSGEYYS